MEKYMEIIDIYFWRMKREKFNPKCITMLCHLAVSSIKQ